MIDPLVRPATEADIAALHHLEQEARASLVDQRGGARWLAEHPEIADDWSAWSGVRDTAGSTDVLVAHIDRVVVGYLVAVLGNDRVVRVDQVWITPEARELGFGDELLATAIARAKDRGAVAVEGQALPGDRHTKNLYERAGIVARLITTYREF